MGRPRKPTEQREFEGNPGQRRLPKALNIPELAAAPPETFGEPGRAMWVRIITALGPIGVLKDSDYFSLVALCEQWEVYQQALADIRERGVLVKSVRVEDDLIRNPSVMVANAALERWTKLASQFGLTPVDRAKLSGDAPADADNPLAKVLEMTRRDAPKRRRST